MQSFSLICRPCTYLTSNFILPRTSAQHLHTLRHFPLSNTSVTFIVDRHFSETNKSTRRPVSKKDKTLPGPFVSSVDNLGPSADGSIVIGLINPDIMNRMRYRFMGSWIVNGTFISTGVASQMSVEPWIPLFGGVLQVTTVLIIGLNWYLTRSIGKLVLKEDNTITFSTVDWLGRRVDNSAKQSDLKKLTKQDHKQFIGKDDKLYFINWDEFKVNESLWNRLIPPAKQVNVMIPDDGKQNNCQNRKKGG